MSDRQMRLHRQMQLFQQRAGAAVELFGLDDPEAARLAAEEDVLGNGKLVYQGELLVDDGNAGRLRVGHARELPRLAIDHDLALVRGVRVDACQYFDQRGLAGTVLADE